MPTPTSRSAALLVRVYVDPSSIPKWRAHIHRYRDAARNEKEWDELTSPAAVLEIVKRWLESVSTN